MLLEIEQAMQAAIKASGKFRTVDHWAGQPEEILKAAQAFPSAWFSYSGADYDEQEIIGATSGPADLRWLLIIAYQDGTATKGAPGYDLIETVRNTMSGCAAAGFGMVWLITDQQLMAAGGKTLHGFVLGINNVQ